jgi:50S ribosome-binding GTPase
MKMSSNFYILGNTGVGKSLICNCLLGRWEFDSKNQADSCTRQVDSVETWVPRYYEDDEGKMRHSALPFRIFNIPGLLEADPVRVQQNVKLLQSALDRKEQSIVLYVLTVEGGRVRDGDYAGFKALSESYDFTRGSFMFIVNKFSKRDNKTHVEAYIRKVLGDYPVGFLPNYDMSDDELKANIVILSKQVVPVIVEMIQHLIVVPLPKRKELKLEADHIRDLKEESRQNKIKFEKELNSLREESNAIQSDNVKKTNQLIAAQQALAAAQTSSGRRSGGAFRLGPLSIEW